jgi:hypothetical protein
MFSGMTRSELVAWGAFLFLMVPLFMAAMGMKIPPMPWEREQINRDD